MAKAAIIISLLASRVATVMVVVNFLEFMKVIFCVILRLIVEIVIAFDALFAINSSSMV